MSETRPPEGENDLNAGHPDDLGLLDELPAPVPPAPLAPAAAPGPTTPPSPVEERRYLSHGPQPEAEPAKPVRQKLHKGFFALGFFTPWILEAVLGGLSGVLSATSSAVANAVANILFGSLSLLGLGGFAAMVAAWLVGRSNGNNKLRSFGIGGLVNYAVMLLLGLLLFGACLITLGQWGK